jgi:hypothetical protein
MCLESQPTNVGLHHEADRLPYAMKKTEEVVHLQKFCALSTLLGLVGRAKSPTQLSLSPHQNFRPKIKT